jgi:hypothetical protein
VSPFSVGSVNFLEQKNSYSIKLVQNLFSASSGAGAGAGRFEKSDPEAGKIRPDLKHCTLPVAVLLCEYRY